MSADVDVNLAGESCAGRRHPVRTRLQLRAPPGRGPCRCAWAPPVTGRFNVSNVLGVFWMHWQVRTDSGVRARHSERLRPAPGAACSGSRSSKTQGGPASVYWSTTRTRRFYRNRRWPRCSPVSAATVADAVGILLGAAAIAIRRIGRRWARRAAGGPPASWSPDDNPAQRATGLAHEQIVARRLCRPGERLSQ